MTDRRHDGPKYPVASQTFTALTFPATGTDALTATLANINGMLEAINIVATDTQDGITYTVAITDGDSATLFSEAALGDNQTHRKNAIAYGSTDADFQAQHVDSTLTLTVTPSAAPDAGEVGTKTATVTVTIFYR